jgi:hypothetical protein
LLPEGLLQETREVAGEAVGTMEQEQIIPTQYKSKIPHTLSYPGKDQA